MEVKLKNIIKEFKNKDKSHTIVLDCLNYTFESSKTTCILGPSGCGKTTILNIISGLLEQDNGDILFDEKIVNNLETRERNLGYVFQDYGLYPHYNVFSNVAYPLKFKKMKKLEIQKKVDNILKILSIDNLAKRKINQLSGGQKQRVAIARALVKEPDIILMDEPLSNVDYKLKKNMRNEIKKILKKLCITTIIVTHDLEDAKEMGDFILKL